MILHNVPVGPGLALLKIEGAMDFAAAPTVRAAVAAAADDRGLARMVIDLGDVTAADDKGVASLAAAVRCAIAKHPSLRVVAVARDHTLAGALTHASVPVYGFGPDALRFIDPTVAA
jgi:anti-anti-sigma regulatory factor